MRQITVAQIREQLLEKFAKQQFVTDKSGVKMVELVSATFRANEDFIFGLPSRDYIRRELEWYDSQSLNVNDIPDGTPAIWTQVADPNGMINSNYGWCVYSKANSSQWENCLEELLRNPLSRRAIMIYTRPSIQYEYDDNGRSDFICTNAVQYMIRDGKMHAVVQMRSNDVVFGYRNDYAWQRECLARLVLEYNEQIFIRSDRHSVTVGDVLWNAGSLHVYERSFYLLDYFRQCGGTHISLRDYSRAYPDSEYAKKPEATG
jgi:thymidylate synthase